MKWVRKGADLIHTDFAHEHTQNIHVYRYPIKYIVLV